MERVYIKENEFNFRNDLTKRDVTDMIVLHHSGEYQSCANSHHRHEHLQPTQGVLVQSFHPYG